MRTINKNNPILSKLMASDHIVFDMIPTDAYFDSLKNGKELTCHHGTRLELGTYYTHLFMGDSHLGVVRVFVNNHPSANGSVILAAFLFDKQKAHFYYLPVVAYHDRASGKLVTEFTEGASDIPEEARDTMLIVFNDLINLVVWTNFLAGVKGVAVKIPRESKGEVRRRLRKKIPSYKFKYLEIGGGDRFYTESSGKKRKGKMGTALHTVCGHIRQFAEDKYCMVTGHIRGDIQFGMVDKHRRGKEK